MTKFIIHLGSKSNVICTKVTTSGESSVTGRLLSSAAVCLRYWRLRLVSEPVYMVLKTPDTSNH